MSFDFDNPTSEAMMTDTKPVMPKICSLVIAASFAIVAPLVPGPAFAGEKGRQAKLQKLVNQRAAQMQADGTVTNGGCTEIQPRGETKQLASLDEMKRLLQTGHYSVVQCIVSGSQPTRFAETLQGLTYFPMATNLHANIEVSDIALYGRRFNATGPMRTNTNWNGATYTTQTGYNSKKSVRASAHYLGTKTVYMILKAATIPIEELQEDCAYSAKDTKTYQTLRDKRKMAAVQNGIQFIDGARKSGDSAQCIHFYPEKAWKEFLDSHKLYSEEWVNRSDN